ncbi:MAG: fumarylacetoacetate hydrolase [Robiginitomaculum sp.]|nr:MAG: fumarylacetoacetate hydrolase [Robiginitomaculum sp.]
MRKTVFSPPAMVTIPVAGSDERFAVRRIFCAGKNYADHIREMGGEDTSRPPVIFAKPADALVSDGRDVPYPRASKDVHHEVELVLALGKPLRDASEEEASKAVYGIASGVDLTRRDLQTQAKKHGGPWTSAKAFDHSAPIGPITPLDGALEGLHGRICLRVNGDIRQDGDLAQMLWSPLRLLTYLSTLFDLKTGDLVFTGTPAGVGPLQIGDAVQAQVDGTEPLHFTMTATV